MNINNVLHTKQKMRNNTIEVMRLCFIIAVIFNHARLFHKPIINGIAVEFFFIVSGFLLLKDINTKNIDLEKNTIRFLYKKVKGFYPAMFISTLLAFCITECFALSGVEGIAENKLYLVSDFLLLQMFNFPTYSATGVVWYLSAMIGAIILLIPLLKKYNSECIYLYLMILVFLIYGFINVKYNRINVILEPFDREGFILCGLARGIAGISLGCLSFKLCCFLKDMNISKQKEKILTAIEILSYLSTFYIGFLYKNGGVIDFLRIFLIFLAITISFSEKSVLFKLFYRHDLSSIGKFTIYLYFNHYYVSKILSKILFNIHPDKKLLIYLVATVMLSVIADKLTLHLREYLKYCINQ